MNGPEHYREAECLLNRGGPAESDAEYANRLARAQVHATLAQAAATAMGAPGSTGMPATERRAWLAAVTGKGA